jgi:DNA-binding LytR/AlgR family response regulator
VTIKLKCILVEDEVPGLTYLKMLCEHIPEVEVIKAFTDPIKFLVEAPALAYDLCILDIEMPGLNGMEVAETLHNKLIIFTTAYKEYAVDAFNVNAVDFVPKPVTKERLQVAIRKAVARKNAHVSKQRIVQLNTEQGRTLINVDEIALITTSEVDSRDKLCVMIDQSSIVFKNLSFETLLALLPEGEFCRVNKKQVLSLRVVKSFSSGEIITKLHQIGKPIRIPLSEVYRIPFQESLNRIL